MPSLISYLTTIHFGAGAIRQLPAILAEQSIRRPLLVTDEGLIRSGICERLPVRAAARFADVQTNPDEASALRGVDVYLGHGCDGILAVGGGSPMDCAKCIGLLVTHPGPLEQYAMVRQGMAKITPNKPPLIAVPTTAGTGSEVGRAALITMNSGAKLGLISPHMIPSAAVCDPELTLELPPQLTAATGMDAISHCVETFCSPRDNPVADAIAIDGLQRGVRWLRAAVERGHEIQPRHEMMMAALEGGLTFQKGLGMIHSLSHPLGSLREKRLHHGTLNAIFLPHVLRFNAAACPEKMRRMASVVGLDDLDQLPDFFEQLVCDVGLPTCLSALNVEASDLAGIAAAAMQDHSTPCNPRPMTEADCQQLLQAALFPPPTRGER